MNTLTTSSKANAQQTGLYYFFAKLTVTVKNILRAIKLKYVPMEEYEQEYIFNDTSRHCPKNPDELADIYVTVYNMFKDIEDTKLFKALLNEMHYANMPMCKTWDTGNVMALPPVMDAPFENIIAGGADRMSTTYWVLWYGDKCEVIHPHQNRGIFRTRREVVHINDKPDAMPEGVTAAAKVTIGVVQTCDNILQGFQWNLYRK